MALGQHRSGDFHQQISSLVCDFRMKMLAVVPWPLLVHFWRLLALLPLPPLPSWAPHPTHSPSPPPPHPATSYYLILPTSFFLLATSYYCYYYYDYYTYHATAYTTTCTTYSYICMHMHTCTQAYILLGVLQPLLLVPQLTRLPLHPHLQLLHALHENTA